MRKVIYIILSCLLAVQSLAATRKCDVCVYGGTASGVMAAVQAARMGMDVIMISCDNHVGGMATSGLTATDINKHAVVGGLTAELYSKIYDYYLRGDAWRNQTRDEYMASTKKRTYSGKNDARRIQWVYESHVCEQIMTDMLSEAGVDVIYSSRLDLQAVPVMRKARIRSVAMEDGTIVRARVFIDASYEGDLMSLSGVSNIVGRESSSMYGESLAGIRRHACIKGSSFLSDGRPVPDMAPALYGEFGDADARTQAYCYRVTLTDDPENMIPLTEPEGYDPAMFEMVLTRMAAEEKTELKDIITFTPMPNRKTDTNHLDYIGASFDYPSAGYARRDEIASRHRLYAEGMLWFLGHDPRVPRNMREEMLRWGWPKDEFTDNGGFPHQLYVREARRMVGEFVITQHDTQGETGPVSDPVGMGSYPMDCHYVCYVAQPDSVMIEGGMFVPVKPYQISYGAIVPQKSECSNLLVPVCLSASHVAYSSLRMEPVYMVLGQSAGTAAALSVKTHRAVQKIDRKRLCSILREDGQILEYNANTTK